MPVDAGQMPPSVVVLAGPNGAGKSTAAPALLHGRLAVEQFVNADEIARGLAGFAPETAAIPAGRIMVARLKELARTRANFAFETTLASRSFAPWLASLVAGGYRFHLVFLWLPSADLAVARVADRVRLGGARRAGGDDSPALPGGDRPFQPPLPADGDRLAGV